MKEISDEIKKEKFKAFFQWLKEDGLVAKRSERLLKKKIFRNLLDNEEMTMENFGDFLEDEEEMLQKLKTKEILENNQFTGKSVLTASGFLTIETIFEVEDGIKVIYQNGSHSILKNIQDLEKVIQ